MFHCSSGDCDLLTSLCIHNTSRALKQCGFSVCMCMTVSQYSKCLHAYIKHQHSGKGYPNTDVLSPQFSLCKYIVMLMCHNVLYLSPMDVIKAHTHTCNHTLTQPCHVTGTSPPGVAENNQIILSGDTSSFGHGRDGTGFPLLCLHPSVSLCLSRSLSPFPPLSFSIKNYYETSQSQ